MNIASRILDRYKDEGVEAAMKSILKDAEQTIIEHREVIILSLDLNNPKAHPTAKDEARHNLVLHDFGPEWVDKCKAMVSESEPARIEQLDIRVRMGSPGFVVTENDQIVAYVFHEHTTPDRPTHPDLEWLDIRLGEKDCYCFDSFIPPVLRGRGIPMFRRVYLELSKRGFERGHGFVNAWDTAPLWSYRVTGWQEQRRLSEYRLFGNKLAVVGDGVYRVNKFDRRRIGTIPSRDA